MTDVEIIKDAWDRFLRSGGKLVSGRPIYLLKRPEPPTRFINLAPKIEPIDRVTVWHEYIPMPEQGVIFEQVVGKYRQTSIVLEGPHLCQ